MTFTEYQSLSTRTLAKLESTKLDMCHLALGMFSEYNELIDAITKEDIVECSEEAADAIFYISNYFTLRGFDLKSIESCYKFEGNINPDTIDIGFVLLDLGHQYSSLQDIVKKYIAYDREIDKSVEIDILNAINSALGAICYKYNLDISRILQNNIDKLKKRYPNEFNIESANNRDLDAERKELEK